MKLDNSFFLVLVLLVVSLVAYLLMQINVLEKQANTTPSYNTVVSDWPVDYWRGGAGWSYPRYRDHPFYPMPHSPHPRPYPPHAPGGGRARHDGGHGH